MSNRAKRILPGGVDSPVRAFSAVGGTPPFIRRAHGACLVDEDGQSYIDFVMSWGPLIHGHAPAGLTRALVRAVKRGTSFGAPTALEVDLGFSVRRLMPSIERIRFVNSGTEATQRAKTEALDRADIDASHVTFVETDFGQTSWFNALLGRGFDPDLPTFILWEGVTYYLY